MSFRPEARSSPRRQPLRWASTGLNRGNERTGEDGWECKSGFGVTVHAMRSGDVIRTRCAAALVGLVALVVSQTSWTRAAVSELTAQDRAEIQQLVASYARALGTCQAEEYADLFAPDGG